jgi:hypothetical protein
MDHREERNRTVGQAFLPVSLFVCLFGWLVGWWLGDRQECLSYWEGHG